MNRYLKPIVILKILSALLLMVALIISATPRGEEISGFYHTVLLSIPALSAIFLFTLMAEINIKEKFTPAIRALFTVILTVGIVLNIWFFIKL